MSSSVGERDVFKSSNNKTITDNGDTNWDINDPDIPARIDQYVSIKMVINIEGVEMVINIERDYGASIKRVLSVIVWREERQIEMILGPHKMLN